MTDPGEQRATVMLPQLRLDDLLNELQGRISEVLATRDRVAGLLDAVLAVGTDLDLQTVLRRIIEAAVTLVDAEYGALGVIGEQGVLAQFLTVGIEGEARLEIGSLPRGHGILGVLIDDPRPLRLDDLTTHPKTYGFPPQHPPMHTFLGVPVRVRNEVFGNLYLTEKRSGGSFDEEDEQIVLALAVAAGIAVENARLYDTIRQRERWVAATAELSASLLSGASPSEALLRITAHAKHLAGADGAVVISPGAGGGSHVVEASEGALDFGGPGSVLALDEGWVERVLSADPEPALLLDRDAVARLGVEGLGWAVVAPLVLDSGSTVLLAVVGDTSSERPSTSIPVEVQAFAQRASLALELANRRRDSERLAVFEDRDRIARDLHDLVIQRLFATGMKLESATRLVGDGEAGGRIRAAVDDLDATIKEIRSTIYALQSPPAAALTDLRSRLLETLEAGAAQLGFPPMAHISPLVDGEVDATVGRQVVAVVREALSNAARHSRATAVEVSVDVNGELVEITVLDNGVGLPVSGRRSGLANLANRAEQRGGTFSVGTPQSGRGTLLQWTAPTRVRVTHPL